MFWKITMAKWGTSVCIITKWWWISLGLKTYLRVSISFCWWPDTSKYTTKNEHGTQKSPKWKGTSSIYKKKPPSIFGFKTLVFQGVFLRKLLKMPGQRPCEVGIVGLLWYAGASLDLSHCWGGFVSRKNWGRNDFISYKTNTKVCLYQLRNYQSTNNWGIKLLSILGPE